MQLTENFKLAEFIRSDTAVKLGNDNMPDTPEILANLRKLADTMEQVRALFKAPINVSSGYRNKVVNAAVGGVSNSDHAMGLACDFMVKGFEKAEIVRRIRNSGIKFDQLIDEPTWVHLGLGVKMRQQVLRARRTGPKNAMVYTAM
jgi:zinc D-Ala-D-Ala carboxypeptidase